jgi:hypothetical protein
MIRTKFNGFYHYCYLTTNLLEPSKKYVGDRTTKNIERDTYLGSGLELQKDIKKLGRWNFSKIILDFYPTRLEASLAQAVFIKLHKTHWSQGGYNLTWTGIVKSEGERHPETLKKIKERAQNRTPEQKQRIADSHCTIECKRKHSEENKRRTPEQIRRHKEACNTPEKREKSRINSLGNKHTKGLKFTAERMLIHMMGVSKITAEQKQKANEAKNTAHWKENQRNAHLGKKQSETTLQKKKIAYEQRPIETCPHCGYQSRNGFALKHFHFDNCKHKIC